TVKKPGVVTLVVDTSGSMAGEKLEQARDGVLRMLDNIDVANRVGLLTFADGLREYVAVAPVSENRFAVVEVAKRMRASGPTELYTALQSAVKMTDEAEADPDATRGVVVLTDGRATGGVPLDRVVEVMSRDETRLQTCAVFQTMDTCFGPNGEEVPKKDVLGTAMAIKTKHPIHIFYVGIGDDADLEVGRILAEATHSAYRATTADTLAAVLEKFGKYF
ncbi:MAG TPA: VWA domain-containing protein, partial [Chloroflexota bacterium]|nr:VWA domain-containing protein [Chloroflexota bacterium]